MLLITLFVPFNPVPLVVQSICHPKHTERIQAEIAIFSKRKWIHYWFFSYRFCQLNLQKSTWNYRLRIHCSMLWELRTLWNINGCFEAVNENCIGQSTEATKMLELKAFWSGLRFVLSNRPSGFVNKRALCAAESGTTFLRISPYKIYKLDVQTLKITSQMFSKSQISERM